MTEDNNINTPETLANGDNEAADDSTGQQSVETTKKSSRKGKRPGLFMRIFRRICSLLGGEMLKDKRFQRQFPYMIFVTVLIIIYVGNRYSCQQEMIESKALSDTLLDMRYKSLTLSGQLMEKTLRSKIEENLQDTTIKASASSPYILNVDE